jgi:hypothetical protein
MEQWRNPRPRRDTIEKGYRRRLREDGSVKTIMYPSTHDITPRNLGDCLTVLRKMLAAGNRVLIVSKPQLECIQALCAELADYKDQILFRFTIGSADDEVLGFYEPGAPGYEERISALRFAHEQGYETSVSSEPMLDDNIHQVIADARPFVTHSIWLGKANNLRARVSLNCQGALLVEARECAEGLIALQCDENIIALYERYKYDDLIRYKDSIKKVVGIESPREPGLDI